MLFVKLKEVKSKMNCYLLFATTNMVFVAEDELKSKGIKCEIVPTPVKDRVCCGMCVKVDCEVKNDAVRVLAENGTEIMEVVKK